MQPRITLHAGHHSELCNTMYIQSFLTTQFESGNWRKRTTTWRLNSQPIPQHGVSATQATSVAKIRQLQSPYIYEFRCQVVVLFLQLPLSSCVVRKACTSYTSLHNTYSHNVYSLKQLNVVNGREFKLPTLPPLPQTGHAQSYQVHACAQWSLVLVEFPDVG